VSKSADNFFATLEEPHKSCLLFLHDFILRHSNEISFSWKFNTPFYYYRNKWLCYISYDKKTKEIYIAFVDGQKIIHKNLVSEGRKKMKIIYIKPSEDIPVTDLRNILNSAILIKQGFTS